MQVLATFHKLERPSVSVLTYTEDRIVFRKLTSLRSMVTAEDGHI